MTVAIWKDGKHPILDLGGPSAPRTLMATLGIELVDAGDDWLRGRMPVDERTRQLQGFLHGGASVALAETLASWAGNCAAPAGNVCVGLEINANHLRSVAEGWVEGVSRPEMIGKTTQVWATRITDTEGRLVCLSRMTLAVVRPRVAPAPGV